MLIKAVFIQFHQINFCSTYFTDKKSNNTEQSLTQ